MKMNRLFFTLLVFLFTILVVVIATSGSEISRTPLHLVALVPIENGNRSKRCVDRGEELIVAANMAAEAINANNTLLQDYRLQVLTAPSDDCAAESFSLALTEFVRYVTNDSYNLVGLIGMVCPSTMLHVSPFASLLGVRLLQITAGATPPKAITRSREERVNIDYIYQTGPPSTVHNDALIALMKDQEWNNIATIRLTSGLNIIHGNQGIDLQDKFKNDSDLNIVFNGEVTTGEDSDGFDRLMDEIKNRRTRIIYATLPDKEAHQLLCRAYISNATSPLYTWVLHDHSIKYLKQGIESCSEQMMTKALNGVILLHHSVTNDQNRSLDYSNMSYGQYEKEYRQRLLNNSITEDMLCGKESEIIHSNAIYDSVVAFAKALNDSQTEVNLTQYGRGMPEDTEHINDNLIEVEFKGAGGFISFDNVTHTLKTKSGVYIHLVHNLKLLEFAYYNVGSGAIDKGMNYSRDIKDRFEEDIRRIHYGLSSTIIAIIALLVIVSVVVLVVYLFNCNAPDIKASSPILSMAILLACFVLYSTAAFTAVRNSFVSGSLFAAFCTMEWWTFSISLQIIFSTLFMRLLRVYRIFFHYQKVSKLWSDWGVLIVIMLMVSISILLLSLWTGIDTLETVQEKIFQQSLSRPHFDVYLQCRSDHLGVWLSLIIGYLGCTMLAVLPLAVMTRKVRIESFRDTKEVNAFVFTTCFLIVVFLPLSLIFELEGASVATLYSSFILKELCLLLVPIACLVFLFVPKLYHTYIDDPTRHKSSIETTGKNTNQRGSFSASFSAAV